MGIEICSKCKNGLNSKGGASKQCSKCLQWMHVKCKKNGISRKEDDSVECESCGSVIESEVRVREASVDRAEVKSVESGKKESEQDQKNCECGDTAALQQTIVKLKDKVNQLEKKTDRMEEETTGSFEDT